MRHNKDKEENGYLGVKRGGETVIHGGDHHACKGGIDYYLGSSLRDGG